MKEKQEHNTGWMPSWMGNKYITYDLILPGLTSTCVSGALLEVFILKECP